ARDALEGGDPVHFPAFSAVVGEGLLEAKGVAGDLGEDEANQDRPIVEHFLVVELASTPLESAVERQALGPSGAAGEADAPLPGPGIVKANRHSLDAARGSGDVQLADVALAVPELAHHRGSGELHPGGRSAEGLGQPPHLRLPGAELEVEVTLPVP